MSQYNEPWTLDIGLGVAHVLAGDKIILTLKEGAIYGGQLEAAQRLVACVNACAGLPMINGVITVVSDMKCVVFSGDEEMRLRIKDYLSKCSQRPTEPAENV